MTLREYLTSLPRGGQKLFAARLKVSKSYLSQLASGQATISPSRAVQIEEASFGVVSRRDTHPSNWMLIWPELATRSDRKAA